MPYRGTNTKRNVVHDKSRGTIKDTSRDHFLAEKKEQEHELAHARTQIQKLLNDGFRFKKMDDLTKTIVVHFINPKHEERELTFSYPVNFDHLKEYFSDPSVH